MDEFKFFKNFKERGEWVELLFMAAALRHGFKILRPWGDSSPFDVAIHFGNRIVRGPGKVHLLPRRHRILLPVQAQLFQRPLHPRPTRLLRRLRNHARHLVPNPSQSPARRPSTKARPDALPHAAPKEKPLPLRALPRSLAPTPPPRQEIARVGRTFLPVAFDFDLRGLLQRWHSYCGRVR
jgi:hypothetical protein